MEDFLLRLKKVFRGTVIPAVCSSLIFIGSVYDHKPFVDDSMGAKITIALLALAMLVFAATSIYFRHASNGMTEEADDDKKNKYFSAYRIRICGLSLMMFLSSVVYMLTHGTQGLYLAAIFLLITLLSYPTKTFVFGR